MNLLCRDVTKKEFYLDWSVVTLILVGAHLVKLSFFLV